MIMPIGQSKAMWQFKWCHMVAKFLTYASGTNWWSNLEPMQVTPPFDTDQVI